MNDRRRNRSEAFPGRAAQRQDAWGLGRVDVHWASREQADAFRVGLTPGRRAATRCGPCASASQVFCPCGCLALAGVKGQRNLNS